MRILSARRPGPDSPPSAVGRFDLEINGVKLMHLALVRTDRGLRVRSPHAFGQAIILFDRDLSDRVADLALSAIGALPSDRHAA